MVQIPEPVEIHSAKIRGHAAKPHRVQARLLRNLVLVLKGPYPTLRMRHRTVISLSTLAFHLLATGQAGSLDTTFSNDGTTTTPIGTYEIGYDWVIQPDGGIVGVGYSDTQIALVRYLPNGSLDPSFSGDGIVITAICTDENRAQAVALQPDGKIVIAGYTSSAFTPYEHPFVARYLPDGSLDPDFGNAGAVIQYDWQHAVGTAIAVQSDGKIVVAGYALFDGYLVLRYDTAGILDTTFGSGGIVVLPLFSDLHGPSGLELLPDGRMLLAGSVDNGFNEDLCVIRLGPDGDLDPSFGVGGITTHPIGNSDDQLNGLAVQPDGRAVVCGSMQAGANFSFALARYDTLGTLDPTFDTDGIVVTDIDLGQDLGLDLLVQPDGRIVAAGYSAQGATYGFALARYEVDGSLDSTFGTNGIVITTFGGPVASVYGVAQQTDGAIVAGGVAQGSDYDFAVARYLDALALGVLDDVNEGNSYLIYPNPIDDIANLTYTLTRPDHLSLRLLDLDGKTIMTYLDNVERAEGEHREQLNLSGVAPGPYLLQMLAEQRLFAVRIIKR